MKTANKQIIDSIYTSWSTNDNSGAERIAQYWNMQNGGQGIDGRTISPIEAENLSDVELANLMLIRQEQVYGTMINSALTDNLPVNTRLDMAAKMQYQQMPADLAMLAEHTPITAMSLINDWLRVTKQKGNLLTHTFGTGADVIDNPAQMLWGYQPPETED